MRANSQKQIHIKMPHEFHKELRVSAAVREITIQEYVVEAIKTRLVKDKKREKTNGRRKI